MEEDLCTSQVYTNERKLKETKTDEEGKLPNQCGQDYILNMMTYIATNENVSKLEWMMGFVVSRYICRDQAIFNALKTN